MALTAHMVTIDCADPHRLAGFWTEALGYELVADLGGYLMLRPADGSSSEAVTVSLQEVPEPKVGKNRVHLDLAATDRVAEVTRLVGLGAHVVSERTYGDYAWTVLADPESNEFCVSGSAHPADASDASGSVVSPD